ncbi:cysteine protease StiP domain-containing protein [Phycicoccus jejuensis]|uniref:cysteine protease StiP domain-containing protein n=1 Tax=Phycicoccus jejuensis TaxID=367299 RepID=UPI00384C3B55
MRDLQLAPVFERELSFSACWLPDAMARLVGKLAALPSPIRLLALARGGISVGAAVAAAWPHSVRPLEWAIAGFDREHGLGRSSANFVDSHQVGSVVILDGWTGSGSTLETVRARFPGRENLVVAALADPAGAAEVYGTDADVLVPPALLMQAASFGLGRPSWDEAHQDFTVARGGWSDDLMNSFIRTATTFAGKSSEVLPASGPTFNDPGQNVLPSCRCITHGMSETWRAYARGHLISMQVEPGLAAIPRLARLIGAAKVPIRRGSCNGFVCLGLAPASCREHQSGLGRDRASRSLAVGRPRIDTGA